MTDPNSGGIARLAGLTLNADGQELDAGTAVLDSSPIEVLAATPANGATKIPRGSGVQITFTEPVQENTINSGSVQLRAENSAVGAGLSMSTDGKTVTLTPNQGLADETLYTIVVSTAVTDRNGLGLRQEFRSTFTTADETAPTVAQISPVDGSRQVPVNSSIVIKTSEPLAENLNLAEVVQLRDEQQRVVGGAASIDGARRVLTFVPAAALNESANYTVTVSGLLDTSGNAQAQTFASDFSTIDLMPPTIDLLSINGATLRAFKPTITATYQDNSSGINTSSVVLTLDGKNVTANAVVTGSSLSYTPTANLSRGSHSVTVRAADNAGNVSQIRGADFTIDDSGPIVSSFTVGGAAAVDDAQVTSSLQPLFEINYTDDTGINPAATKLYLGLAGAPPAEVSATITNTKLTYRPSAPLAEGNYTMRAVITNALGTSTDTGSISFTLDVDAPEIQTVNPEAGNQHGATSVILSGVRLLNTNNSSPVVTVGNNPATVTSAAAGTNGSFDQITITTPAGAPGNSVIRVTTDRGVGNARFDYTPDAKTPFVAEPDTILLWHLDEAVGDYYNVRVADAGQYGISGSAYYVASQPGRFGNGLTSTFGSYYVYTDNPNGLLSFKANSFTSEFWFKTPQSTSDRQLVRLYNDGYGDVGSLNLSPTGALTATIKPQNGNDWTVSMPPNVLDVDDNQWHQVAMVLDRAQEKLILYVDGIERASQAKTAPFDEIRGGGYQTRLFMNQFVGYTLDEVRVSSTAHSAQQIQNGYLGSEGNTGLQIFNSSHYSFAQGETANIGINGYNLAGINVAASDSAGNSIPIELVSGSATRANLRIAVGSEAALGSGQIVLSVPPLTDAPASGKSGAGVQNANQSSGVVTIPIRIVNLSRIVSSPEPDTILLWHLDETATNSYFLRVADAGQYGISGSAYYVASQPGRFGNGLTSTFGSYYVYTDNPNGMLNFGANSFTSEFWFKTPRNDSDRQLVRLYNDGYGDVGSLNLSPTGALTATIKPQNGNDWTVSMPPNVLDVDDNQWHQVAMVLDRAQEKLILYVDGIERASQAKTAPFDEIRGGGYQTRLFMNQFVGYTLDEVRVSSTAHSAQVINQDFNGESSMRITSYSNPEIYRNNATAANEITVDGYNLENVTAQVFKDGQPVSVSVNTVSSSYRQAVLKFTPGANAPLGFAQVVVTKDNQPAQTFGIKISELNEIIAENGTVLLWHLNEVTPNQYSAVDSGALGLHGYVYNSSNVPGRFGNGVAGSGYIYRDSETYGAFNFGASSFTAEQWFKASPYGGQRRLMWMNNNYRGDVMNLRLEQSGALSASVTATNGTVWQLAMNRTYNPQTGYWTSRFDDNQWHHVALVVDQSANKLRLYIDGAEKASADKPAGFDAFSGGEGGGNPYYDNRFFAQVDPQIAVDEVRLTNYAETFQQIRNTWFGVAPVSRLLLPKTAEPTVGVKAESRGLPENKPLAPKSEKAESKTVSSNGGDVADNKTISGEVVPSQARAKTETSKQKQK